MTAPETLAGFLARHDNLVRVRIETVQGSAPREAGTEMLVATGDMHGTIGGGQLEYMALDQARALLAAGGTEAAMDLPLGPEIGQCCGGRVGLSLRRMDAADRQAARDAAAADRAARPHVLIFGAGHVGRALGACLALLPVRATLIDSRAEELARCTAPVAIRLSALPEAEIRAAPPRSAFVVLTHDHALDFLLTAEALSRGDAAYVGMIGSATKRARFARYAREHCDAPGDGPGNRPETAALTCPIGAAGGADKRPAVIAAFVAAEVMAALAVVAAPVARTARQVP